MNTKTENGAGGRNGTPPQTTSPYSTSSVIDVDGTGTIVDNNTCPFLLPITA